MARAAANEPAIAAGEMALLEFIGDPFQKRRRDLRNRYLSLAFRTSEESGNVLTYSKLNLAGYYMRHVVLSANVTIV